MMNLFTRSREGKRSRFPARWGLVAFLVFCLAVLGWDLNRGNGDAMIDAAAIPEPAESSGTIAENEIETDEGKTDEDVRTEALSATFAAYRLDREEARSAELLLLEMIISDEGGSVTIRDEAEQRRLRIASDIENEAAAESLLDARGFGETVVIVSEDKASVVCSGDLTDKLAAEIAQIVSEICFIDFENIVIVNK